ncbi:hypothetical protein KCU61_g125, partial [Aureobasidium melanogenum]
MGLLGIFEQKVDCYLFWYAEASAMRLVRPSASRPCAIWGINQRQEKEEAYCQRTAIDRRSCLDSPILFKLQRSVFRRVKLLPRLCNFLLVAPFWDLLTSLWTWQPQAAAAERDSLEQVDVCVQGSALFSRGLVREAGECGMEEFPCCTTKFGSVKAVNECPYWYIPDHYDLLGCLISELGGDHMSSQSRVLQVQSVKLVELCVDDFDRITSSSSRRRVPDTDFMRAEREDKCECEEGRDANEQEHESPAGSWSYGHAGCDFVGYSIGVYSSIMGFKFPQFRSTTRDASCVIPLVSSSLFRVDDAIPGHRLNLVLSCIGGIYTYLFLSTTLLVLRFLSGDSPRCSFASFGTTQKVLSSPSIKIGEPNLVRRTESGNTFDTFGQAQPLEMCSRFCHTAPPAAASAAAPPANMAYLPHFPQPPASGGGRAPAGTFVGGIQSGGSCIIGSVKGKHSLDVREQELWSFGWIGVLRWY